ncbi:MAG: hypothetical protein HY722_08065, partial [Planctomycetes bacterium]|nr:hypothetical protein [Planctomycetota bacterium]
MSETGETLKVPCPSCGVKFSVPAAWAGKRFKCKKCGEAVDIPALAVVELELPPVEEPLRLPEPASAPEGLRLGAGTPPVPAAPAAGAPVAAMPAPVTAHPAGSEAAPSAQARPAAPDRAMDALYDGGHRSLKQRLEAAKDKGQELLSGKKGYHVGEGTMRIMKSAVLMGAEGVEALRLAADAERRTTGRVNPLKESLAYGFEVTNYVLRFAGDDITILKKRPWREKDGSLRLLAEKPVPFIYDLMERYRGLDAREENVSLAMRTLDFRKGRDVRLRVTADGLEAETALWRLREVERDPKTGFQLYVLDLASPLPA